MNNWDDLRLQMFDYPKGLNYIDKMEILYNLNIITQIEFYIANFSNQTEVNIAEKVWHSGSV